MGSHSSAILPARECRVKDHADDFFFETSSGQPVRRLKGIGERRLPHRESEFAALAIGASVNLAKNLVDEIFSHPSFDKSLFEFQLAVESSLGQFGFTGHQGLLLEIAICSQALKRILNVRLRAPFFGEVSADFGFGSIESRDKGDGIVPGARVVQDLLRRRNHRDLGGDLFNRELFP